MKYKLIIVACFIMLSHSGFAINLKTTLTGTITDKKTGESLAGVSVYIPDLKTGAITNKDGAFKIENLPSKLVLVQVSFIGYQTVIEHIDLSNITTLNVSIESSVKEIHDLVITGMSKAVERNRTPTSITSLSHTLLLQTASTNIIDALTTQAGVSQVTTGSGISKPVIRGLGYNRVVVVNDGIRQEGQQWGDEHGIEIDENSIYKVEILKGPASLSFGSDAMAGVVNMISFPTLPDGKINASLSTNYQSNMGLYAVSGNIGGNQHGYIWDVRYSNKAAHDYKNKYDGYVLNSRFQENTFNAMLGINRSWGYSHLNISSYHLKPGIIEGTRDSASGKFIKEVAENDSTTSDRIASMSDFKQYKPATPFQQIHHYKAVWNSNLYIHNGSLKFSVGYQQNRRQEFADVLKPSTYGLYFLLNTINYDVRYVFPEAKHWNLSIGANGMYQSSQNKGTEFLVPEYNLFDVGAFFIAKKTINKFDFSGGFRYDVRAQQGNKLILDENGNKTELDSTQYNHKFAAFNSTFKGVSGSVGFAYQFSKKVFTKLNISRGFRSPNIGELGANGEHEGTNRYEIGDSKLKPETSWELDYAIGVNTEHLTFELDLYNNAIQNYIYQRKLVSVFGGDSLMNGLQSFRFMQSQANLLGGEFMIDIHPHPLDWLHIQNAFSYVQAQQLNQPDSTKYLPLIPAPKLRTEFKVEKSKLGNALANAYATFDIENYFAQNHYFKAFGTETSTPSYNLLNLGLGAQVVHKKQTLCSLFISVNNLTNKSYQSHLSRLKYTDTNNATGRVGVYNMGRNASIKLIIPFTIK